MPGSRARKCEPDPAFIPTWQGLGAAKNARSRTRPICRRRTPHPALSTAFIAAIDVLDQSFDDRTLKNRPGQVEADCADRFHGWTLCPGSFRQPHHGATPCHKQAPSTPSVADNNALPDTHSRRVIGRVASQPHEAKPGDPGNQDGLCLEVATSRRHLSQRQGRPTPVAFAIGLEPMAP